MNGSEVNSFEEGLPEEGFSYESKYTPNLVLVVLDKT